ncbi:MAG: hypothetical protein BWX83_01221 [Candidatus Cloacimonetes bacterium ADurb.Bin117]|nr:MAG: hypothetical protein BWX83_01221 [Candidatus Cloacimonetes bacterium ADurb.Bin117]
MHHHAREGADIEPHILPFLGYAVRVPKLMPAKLGEVYGADHHPAVGVAVHIEIVVPEIEHQLIAELGKQDGRGDQPAVLAVSTFPGGAVPMGGAIRAARGVVDFSIQQPVPGLTVIILDRPAGGGKLSPFKIPVNGQGGDRLRLVDGDVVQIPVVGVIALIAEGKIGVLADIVGDIHKDAVPVGVYAVGSPDFRPAGILGIRGGVCQQAAILVVFRPIATMLEAEGHEAVFRHQHRRKDQPAVLVSGIAGVVEGGFASIRGGVVVCIDLPDGSGSVNINAGESLRREGGILKIPGGGKNGDPHSTVHLKGGHKGIRITGHGGEERGEQRRCHY